MIGYKWLSLPSEEQVRSCKKKTWSNDYECYKMIVITLFLCGSIITVWKHRQYKHTWCPPLSFTVTLEMIKTKNPKTCMRIQRGMKNTLNVSLSRLYNWKNIVWALSTPNECPLKQKVIISDWKSLLFTSESKAIKFVEWKISISDHLTLTFYIFTICLRAGFAFSSRRSTTINQKLFKRGSTFFDTPFVDKMPRVLFFFFFFAQARAISWCYSAVFKVRT